MNNAPDYFLDNSRLFFFFFFFLLPKKRKTKMLEAIIQLILIASK